MLLCLQHINVLPVQGEQCHFGSGDRKREQEQYYQRDRQKSSALGIDSQKKINKRDQYRVTFQSEDFTLSKKQVNMACPVMKDQSYCIWDLPLKREVLR